MLGLLRGSCTVHVYDRKYHIHIWALYCHVKNYTQCKGHCAGHVHDKDYHIRIWALYRYVTNIYNLGYTYMSMHTIHNVSYSARVYAPTNADLGAYAHRNIISIYGNFQEIHSKCILLASADLR